MKSKTGGGEGLGTKLLLYAHNIGTARGGRWGGCIVVGGRTGRGEGEGEEGMGREGGVRRGKEGGFPPPITTAAITKRKLQVPYFICK